jgi:hypothetical protein
VSAILQTASGAGMLRNVFYDNKDMMKPNKGLLSTEKKGKSPATIISPMMQMSIIRLQPGHPPFLKHAQN